jgi:hypothetical protein
MKNAGVTKVEAIQGLNRLTPYIEGCTDGECCTPVAMMRIAENGEYLDRDAVLEILESIPGEVDEREKRHQRQLADCRKKCEDFGRKINALAHENKRLRALPEGEPGERTLPEVTDETVQEFVWLGKKIESKYMAPETKRQLIEEFLLELRPRVPDSQKGGE